MNIVPLPSGISKYFRAAWTAEDEGVLHPDRCWAFKSVEGDIAPESILMGTGSSHLTVSNERIVPYRNKDQFSKRKNECFTLLCSDPGEVCWPPYTRDYPTYNLEPGVDRRFFIAAFMVHQTWNLNGAAIALWASIYPSGNLE